MRILTNENMLKVLQEHIPKCNKIIIVAGYMTAEGFALIEYNLECCIKSGGKIQIYIGKLIEDNDYTRCIRFLDKWCPQVSIFVVNDPQIFVHGKIYLLQKEHHSILILGSSNLTFQGLVANQEINAEAVLDEKGLNVLMKYVNNVDKIAVPIKEFKFNVKKGAETMANKKVSEQTKRDNNPNFIMIDDDTFSEEEDFGDFGDTYDGSTHKTSKFDEDIAEWMRQNWDENLVDNDTLKLDFETRERIGQIANKVFDYIDQDTIDDWYYEIDEMSKEFNEIINEDELIHSGRRSGEAFKTQFLAEKVWAIVENKHTDLWPRIRNCSGDKIVEHILDMLEAVENGEDADEVLAKGKIYNVIGTSIASEILHKCYPQMYPIKNKRSHWGMAFILNQGDGCEYIEKMSYSQFTHYVDAIYNVFAEWLESQGIEVDADYRYFICDRFFWYISENEHYHLLMREYTKGKKDSDKPWL